MFEKQCFLYPKNCKSQSNTQCCYDCEKYKRCKFAKKCFNNPEKCGMYNDVVREIKKSKTILNDEYCNEFDLRTEKGRLRYEIVKEHNER